MLRTSAVKRSASKSGNKSSKQSSFGLDIHVGKGIALSKFFFILFFFFNMYQYNFLSKDVP